eukprot:scaffold3165_cov62-Cyclotella_meneghiniana.AAC.3
MGPVQNLPDSRVKCLRVRIYLVDTLPTPTTLGVILLIVNKSWEKLPSTPETIPLHRHRSINNVWTRNKGCAYLYCTYTYYYSMLYSLLLLPRSLTPLNCGSLMFTSVC